MLPHVIFLLFASRGFVLLSISQADFDLMNPKRKLIWHGLREKLRFDGIYLS